MDDLISRQALLNKFEPWLKVKDYSDGELNMLKAILYEIRFMSATDTNVGNKLGTNLAEVGTDCISRQDAIDALKKAYWDKDIQSAKDDPCIVDAMTDWAIRQVKALPSAQPEIIYCKDCKHFVREDYEEYTPNGFYNTYFSAFCDKHWDKEQGEYIDVKMDDYCSFAERRTDEA